MGNSVQVQVLFPAPNEFLTSDPPKGKRRFFIALRVVEPNQTKKLRVFSGHTFPTFPFAFFREMNHSLLWPVLTPMAEYFRKNVNYRPST